MDLSPVDWPSQIAGFLQRPVSSIAASDGEGGQLFYHALAHRAHRLALVLQRHGLSAGQSVAHCLPNSLDAIWVAYGLKLAGVADTPLAWGATTDELTWCLSLAKTDWVISLRSRADALKALGVRLICIEDLLENLDEARSDHSHDLIEAWPAVPGDAPGRILFTSGTTGRPKAVLYSHARRWQGERLQREQQPFTPAGGDCLLLMTPFIHGASLLTFAWLAAGAEVVLLDGVNLPVVDRLFATSALSAVFAPPTVLAKLTRAWPQRQVAGVRCVFTGTQPLTPGLYRQARHMFGPVVRITYGKTECINPITVLTPEQTEDFFQTSSDEPGACVGWPAPGVELRIDPDTTELWLRAPQMSLGFMDANGLRPHEPEGWHATGDLGAWDRAGRLRLTGRVADVIKTGGYRVNPDEIEACLSSLAEASSVCITSLPSDYWGEVIIAVCEREGDEWRTRVEEACEPLSRHKRPRLFVQLATLPRNAQGKVSRRAVREAVLQAHHLIDGPYPRLQPKD